MPLYSKSHSNQCLILHSLEKLTAALNIAIAKSATNRVVTIYLDLGVLHFQAGMNPKRCGTRRAIQCCDGSKRSASLSHALVLTYSMSSDVVLEEPDNVVMVRNVLHLYCTRLL